MNVQDADDAYEAHSYRGLFYALGASDRIRKLALDQWNAITRLYDDASEGVGHPAFKVQLHDEYYFDNDWFHMGEGNQTFYSLGLVDLRDPDYVRRARRFADLYLGENLECANYDPDHRVIRSPFHGSTGPIHHADLERVKIALDPVYRPGGIPRGHAQRANMHPLVVDLEEDWYEDLERRQEICRLFDEVVLHTDIPDNLACTALVTSVYLCTGEEDYKKWVLDYTEAWMERTRTNDGIIPDNVGPTGKIGEGRNGQWWGGWYGWNSRNSARNAFLAATIAGECCVLLTGDFQYLDLIRSQVELLLDLSKTREDGQLLVPTRMTPDGYGRWRFPLRSSRAPCHHPSPSRFQYYDGQNPDWPVKRLEAEYRFVSAIYEHMRLDTRDEAAIVKESLWPPNPVVVKGLVQVTMGSPQPIYNGGLLRAQVRYFDGESGRPGLPEDVAALVDALASDRVGIQLHNLSGSETRTVLVQAGAFGEHGFLDIGFETESREGLDRHAALWLRDQKPWTKRQVRVDDRSFAVRLPPSTSIRLRCGLRRFAHDPSCQTA